MRLYNPNYGKESKQQIRRRKSRKAFATFFTLLFLSAAIGGLICCIYFKVKWYYYVADICGGVILCYFCGLLVPNEPKEYIDFPILDENVDEYVQRCLREITPEKVMSNEFRLSDDNSILGGKRYNGIWRGIAVCRCGKVYDLEDVTFDAEKINSITTSDENSSVDVDVFCINVKCRCSKCGKVYEESYQKRFTVGTLNRKHIMFTDKNVITSKRNDADISGFVRNVYDECLARHKEDCKKYEKIRNERKSELRKRYAIERERAQRKADEGWYAKESDKING